MFHHEAITLVDHFCLHQLVDALPVVHAFARRLAPGLFARLHHRPALAALAVVVERGADLRHQRLHRLGLVLAQQAHAEEHDVGLHRHHVVALGGDLLVPRRQEQVLAALPLVRADHAQVFEHALVHVHHHARHQPLGQGQHQRTGLRQVSEGRDVRRREVGSEDALLLLLGDVGNQLAVAHLEDIVLRVLPLDHPGGGDAPQVSLGGPHQVHLAEQVVHGLLRRVTAIEFQFADRGIDGFHLARRHLGRHRQQRAADRSGKQFLGERHIG
ncbi:hypothetical protein D3C78_1223480 [compost metagenome]